MRRGGRRSRTGEEYPSPVERKEEPPTNVLRRPGKEHCPGGTDADEGPDLRLPSRLFATDRYPSNRLNVYSSLELLLVVRDVLRGTPEWDRLMGSCFGTLYQLPVRRCSYASVMIHAMLARQLVTKKRYEVWPVFGGNPWRFSLVEFGGVTGLPCGEFEAGYAPDIQPAYKEADYAFWDKLFEGKRDITIPDVVKMLKEDLTLTRSRKFKLCLLLIVDGVLIASTQPAKPTVKYVKLLANVNQFLAFPWGRESYFWTVKTMLPAKKVIGLCDDPEGEFCVKLRQKTKQMVGFPLALQLLAYEVIPQLLARLGGTDELKIVSCERIPKHAGVNLVDVLEAEHHPELIVQPMMEVPDDVDEGWGVWDDEIVDRRVTYMVGKLVNGQNFKKMAWGGGDGKEDLYDHEAAKEVRKRKRNVFPARVVEGAVMKQKRVSGYFRRTEGADREKEEVLARVVVLEKAVEWLTRKLLRRKRVGLTPMKERLRSGTVQRKRKKKTKETSKEDNPFEDATYDDWESGGAVVGKGSPVQMSEGGGDESSEPEKGDKSIDGAEFLPSNSKEHSGAEEEVEDSVDEGETDRKGGASDSNTSDEQPPVLVPLSEGDGVPLQWVEQGVTGYKSAVLYRATTSQTFFVGEEKGEIVSDDFKEGEKSEAVECKGGEQMGVFVAVESSIHGDPGGQTCDRLDDLIGGIVKEHAGDEQGELSCPMEPVLANQKVGEESGTELKGTLEDEPCDSRKDLVFEVDLEREGVEEEVLAEYKETAEESIDLETPLIVRNDEDGVTYLSDSSQCPPSEKHCPVEAEAQLASLLLAKEPFTLAHIVPAVEDPDIRYFEQVLQADPKVLHVGVGQYDLENQFFLDLATAEKWVTSKHMEVLVDYVGQRHAEVLQRNRAMFVAPWFMEQLAGKAKTFNATTYKGRVFSDRKLAGYLTKKGQKLGVDVDEVYAPMFWGTDHWVGLRISLSKWSVLVYDPNRKLRTMDEVMTIMTPIAKMLPYLVRKVCPANFLGGHGLEPFGVELMADGYQNTRSGDCGPVALKFMELAATGVKEPDVDDLTDSSVDIFRKQYAMDVYKDWVVPLYMCGEGSQHGK